MAGKAKVLIFHFGFFYSGGGEKLVLKEIEYLLNEGYKVDCFASVVDKKSCFPELIKNLPVAQLLPQLPIWFPKKDTLQVLLTTILFPFFSYKFRNYDAVIGANQPGPYFAFWLKKLFTIPYIVYIAQPLRMLHPRQVDRESGFFLREKLSILPYLVRLFSRFIDWADKKSMESADCVLVNGDYVAGLIKRVYKIKPIVCPAGCEVSGPSTLPRSKFKGKISLKNLIVTKPYILLTNRHVPQKRFEYAILSLPRVLGQMKDVKLVITGAETEYTATLKKLVSELELKKYVIFTGLLKEKDLKTLYRNALLYVYTAPEEDFGMGIIEAMAAGTPVVAWKKGGPTSTVIHGETGFLAEPKDISSFASYMSILIEDEILNRRMGRKAKKRAREFTDDKHFQILENTLSSILKV